LKAQTAKKFNGSPDCRNCLRIADAFFALETARHCCQTRNECKNWIKDFAGLCKSFIPEAWGCICTGTAYYFTSFTECFTPSIFIVFMLYSVSCLGAASIVSFVISTK
jgi:hypothetical protein